MVDQVLRALFWGSSFGVFFTYVGFAGVLWVWSWVRKPPSPPSPSDRDALPTITIIVAAFNEEVAMPQRMENLRGLNYPPEKLTILVASDGSTDGTVAVARRYPEATVLDFKENRGKASVHNDSVLEAQGDVILFLDAETHLEPDFLFNASGYLLDPGYGCGAGDLTFRPLGAVGPSEALYWRMEKVLRRLEHSIGILPFASGGCFFLKRELYEPIASHSDIDNILPLRAIEAGRRVFYAEESRCFDVTAEDPGTHYRKRVRTAQRSITDILSRFPALARAGRVRELFVLFSHRILRWTSGFLAGIAFLANIGLVVSAAEVGAFWVTCLGLQLFFYCLSGLGWLMRGRELSGGLTGKVATAAYAFFLAHLAFCVALTRAASGARIQAWKNQ